MNAIDPAGGSGRSPAKRAAIVAAARVVFGRHGYIGASMDEVSAEAGVSKRTVYQHFADKQDLFRTAVLDAVDRGYELFRPHNEALADVPDDQLPDALLALADLAYRGLLAPELLRMRRLVMAEAERFPHLGREYYDRSWGRSVGGLAHSIGRLHARGVLHAPDHDAAAHTFVMLVAGRELNRAAFLGAESNGDADHRHRVTREAVRIFLTAHSYGRAG
ncbi:TetR/AcrR family transcriptional regulator [Tenggerimyces flavus]|uniref:TetR/AcrR family transcriptional regulator n=1 Tax=Tenggerimyces flavus TaxID=1708749 RepID=A0ABV7Y5L9_9ACTN|nr:TetR/AcrR family transcriptional regulator [Tenggerimyces flavus]MBM7784984.1 TetR/AcrR family transcriptional repressor of mexJK operon [Tenggerimyces flavus]